MSEPIAQVCSVDGCAKPRRSGGMCSMHEARMRSHGTTDAVRPPGRPAVPPELRFFRRVEWSDRRHDGTRCMEWTGDKSGNGYGRFAASTVKGKPQRQQAHRWLYERWVGPIPDGLVIDHLCRNRACVNPLHLEPVTNRENVMRGDAPELLRRRRTKRETP